MTWKEAYKLLINEESCAVRAAYGSCDKECKSCNQFRKTLKLTHAYACAMKALEKEIGSCERNAYKWLKEDPNRMYCSYCSTRLGTGYNYCPICGYRIIGDHHRYE